MARLEERQDALEAVLKKLMALYRAEHDRHRLGIPPRPCPLTTRQWQVVSLLAEGLTIRQAADRLGRSASVAHEHSRRAVKRLGARNLAHAVAICVKRGWL